MRVRDLEACSNRERVLCVGCGSGRKRRDLKQKLSQEHQPPPRLADECLALSPHLGGADGGIGFMLMQLQRFLEWQLHGQERHCEYRENHRGLLQRRQTDYIAPAIASRTALLIFPAAPMRLQLKAAGS
eukprot:CAMPEP_0180160614 /NCGR_PEP_ID=MMETSP0986-20121125/28217_1 /TAXON_ID=697907 /ORGANISM="non described non described, Strain CCMP2293" /LENGTH=128 /DNA_ID=CAMNT_0022110909 /DNA_START=833 /DNA_END=1220 /DNA_ORIENTATION=+